MDYYRKRAIVRAPILSWKGLIGFGFVILVICGAQLGIAGLIENARITKLNETIVVEKARCTVASVQEDGTMRLSCHGEGGNRILKDSATALGYQLRPRDLECTIYEGNSPNCTFVG